MAMWSLESIVRLGWSFVKTLLRSVAERPKQLPRFVAQYRPDGMLAREAGDHEAIVAAGRCIGCGRCDLRAIELGAPDALGSGGPMTFVQGVSRQAGIDDPSTPRATKDLLDELTAVCPVGVQFVPLVALVRRRHRELIEARSLPAARNSLPPPPPRLAAG
jgi:ferredoxin